MANDYLTAFVGLSVVGLVVIGATLFIFFRIRRAELSFRNPARGRNMEETNGCGGSITGLLAFCFVMGCF